MVEVKFCGLTRPDDARHAGTLGASYLGVIFAGGPRTLSAANAATVLDGGAGNAKRVGVFGAIGPSEVARIARQARLDIVQLHADPTPAHVRAVRTETGAEVWATVRVVGALPDNIDELFAAADAVLVDARVEGALGGSGVSVEWAAIAAELDRRRGGRPLVLAGGLTPANVGQAMATLSPSVVDVSSGVESAPGIKDHARMRAFAAAVAAAAEERE